MTNVKFCLVATCFMVGLTNPLIGQTASIEDRPKIGLVLSGGGAKGFAHIGVLKRLEELGIKPDIITGTSMGSVVGGLYSIGYSADEILEFASSTDWDRLLSNEVSLEGVNYVEKRYYGTYWVELNLNNGKFSLPSGLIRGQNLYEKLNELCYPAHGITDFKDFPIPFACVATDIESGNPICLTSGNLVDAIRASMAIPSIFTPVQYDSLLLIDGGWTRNLPVQEAIDLGADIIIAVDVSSPLKDKSELDNAISILDQTAWFLSDQDSKSQRELSSIVIYPDIKAYESFDFEKSKEITATGYKAALAVSSALDSLGKSIPKSDTNTEVSEKKIQTFRINSVAVEGTKTTDAEFVVSQFKFKEDRLYSWEEIESQIREVFGSLYYLQVGFKLIPENDGYHLLLTVIEDSPIKVKTSLNYDSENGVGLDLNLTARNFLLRKSRFIFSALVSENPIVELNYLKYLNQRQSLFSFVEGQFLMDQEYEWKNLLKLESIYNYVEISGAAGLGFSPGNKSQIQVGISKLYARAKPKQNPDGVIHNFVFDSYPLFVKLKYNSLDRYVLPRKGIQFNLGLRYGLAQLQEANLTANYDTAQAEVNEAIAISDYFHAFLSYKEYVRMGSRISMFAGGNVMMNFSSDIGFNDFVRVGGINPILHNSLQFYGLTREEAIVPAAFTAELGLRFRMITNFYLQGRINYLNTKYPMSWIYDYNKSTDFNIGNSNHNELFGYGGELIYRSPIGPIKCAVHGSTYSPTINMFVGIGFIIRRTPIDKM